MFKTKVLLKVLDNYFLIAIVSTVVALLTGKGYVISILFPLLLFILAKKAGWGRASVFDGVFIFIVLSMLLSWGINGYPNKWVLIFRCIIAEGSYMAAYFIGKRWGRRSLDSVFRQALIPLGVCCVIGIYLFFRPPGWYVARLYNSVMYYGGELSLELLRLRSIFSSPYDMAYMCGLTSIWLLFRIFRYKETDVRSYVFLGLFIVTMMFCMMRAPFGCVVLSFLVALFYYSFYNSSIKTILVTSVAVLIIAYAGMLVLQNINADVYNFIMSKFESATTGRDELVNERVNLWNYNYYILGDGAGRHAMLANDFNPHTSIQDSEYIKILVEQGYFGLSLYILLLSLSLIKCIRYFKYLPFEMCVVVFYVVTMVGANSLSTADKHCFLFWLTVGRIAAFKKPAEKNNVYNSYKVYNHYLFKT